MRVTDLEVDNIIQQEHRTSRRRCWMRDGDKLEEVIEHESGDNSDYELQIQVSSLASLAQLLPPRPPM